jgi:hypothetical protein
MLPGAMIKRLVDTALDRGVDVTVRFVPTAATSCGCAGAPSSGELAGAGYELVRVLKTVSVWLIGFLITAAVTAALLVERSES